MLEIARLLAVRGYQIDFGAAGDPSHLLRDVDFISQAYSLAPAIVVDDRFPAWDPRNPLKSMLRMRQWLDSSWSDVYRSLGQIAMNPKTRPDFLFADFFCFDVSQVISHEFGIPLATHWGQMPQMMVPATYIPGYPGLQREVLTSEHATMWQRLDNELVLIKALPQLIRYIRWLRTLRRQTGVEWIPPRASKPSHLVLINSYFGLEAPKDLPPLMSAIGPVLSDSYTPLKAITQNFLQTRQRVVYHTMGTVLPPLVTLIDQVAGGFLKALDAGIIDGAIWAIKSIPWNQLDSALHTYIFKGKNVSLEEVLGGMLPDILVLDHAEQRAILDHPNTALYLTHGGQSSVNELTYYGVPAITLAYMTDQLQNALRLRDAGISISLDSREFTAEELCSSIRTIIEDVDGSFARNVRRMKQIAGVNARRKHVAADLIEETLFDHEGRHTGGKELRPMHRQTADTRMPWYKAKNWDLWAVISLMGLISVSGLAGVLIVSWRVGVLLVERWSSLIGSKSF